jgi:hypothetical protein
MSIAYSGEKIVYSAWSSSTVADFIASFHSLITQQGWWTAAALADGWKYTTWTPQSGGVIGLGCKLTVRNTGRGSASEGYVDFQFMSLDELRQGPVFVVQVWQRTGSPLALVPHNVWAVVGACQLFLADSTDQQYGGLQGGIPWLNDPMPQEAWWCGGARVGLSNGSTAWSNWGGFRLTWQVDQYHDQFACCYNGALMQQIPSTSQPGALKLFPPAHIGPWNPHPPPIFADGTPRLVDPLIGWGVEVTSVTKVPPTRRVLRYVTDWKSGVLMDGDRGVSGTDGRFDMTWQKGCRMWIGGDNMAGPGAIANTSFTPWHDPVTIQDVLSPNSILCSLADDNLRYSGFWCVEVSVVDDTTVTYGSSATSHVIGMLWDAVWRTASLPGDSITMIEGFNWICYTIQNDTQNYGYGSRLGSLLLLAQYVPVTPGGGLTNYAY